MRSRLTVFIILLVALIFGLLFARQAYLSRDLPREAYINKKLRILTYASFVSSQGPGGQLIAAFKKAKGLDIDVVSVSDAGILLERLKLSQGNAPFDVVIGLDQILLAKARAQFRWKPIAPQAQFRDEAKLFGVDPFVPFDWAPMTFIYREGTEIPLTFAELANPKFKGMLALQDPRTSSPGLQFYNWVKLIKEADTVKFLKALEPNVQSVSPSWSFAYGLFKKEQARFVFSYVTSLAFHWGVEKDKTYQALIFPEGHPTQVEFAAVPETCRECELAKEFVLSLLEPEAQKVIMEKNFMLPVIAGPEKGTVFADLPKPKALKVSSPEMVDFNDWDQVFKH